MSGTTEAHCVVLVGTTGAGKTEVANAIKAEDATVEAPSNRTESSTQAPYSFAMKNGDTGVDTQGMLDSGGLKSDADIAKEIIGKVLETGLRKVKVVWCAGTGTGRESADFQRQARFITSLKQGTDATAAQLWNAVLILVKCGSEDSDFRGTRAAAITEGGVPSTLKSFGVTILDADPGRLHTMEKYVRNSPFEIRKQDGYLYRREYTEFVTPLIEELSAVTIGRMNKRCRRCPLSGDPRMLPEFCHDDTESVHPGRVESYTFQLPPKEEPDYSQILEWKHPGKYEGKLGGFQRDAPAITWIHPARWVMSAVEEITEEWTCCGNGKRGSRGCQPCRWGTKLVARSEQRARHSCCRRDAGSTPCRNQCRTCRRLASEQADQSRCHGSHQWIDASERPTIASWFRGSRV